MGYQSGYYLVSVFTGYRPRSAVTVLGVLVITPVGRLKSCIYFENETGSQSFPAQRLLDVVLCHDVPGPVPRRQLRQRIRDFLLHAQERTRHRVLPLHRQRRELLHPRRLQPALAAVLLRIHHPLPVHQVLQRHVPTVGVNLRGVNDVRVVVRRVGIVNVVVVIAPLAPPAQVRHLAGVAHPPSVCERDTAHLGGEVVGFFRVVVELPRRGVDGAECTRPPDHGVCVVVVGDDPANLQAVALAESQVGRRGGLGVRVGHATERAGERRVGLRRVNLGCLLRGAIFVSREISALVVAALLLLAHDGVAVGSSLYLLLHRHARELEVCEV
mmetsp:Transcript_7771/g.35206  ORF Transcript_7771/g.35206 Transcript_7771/m.35206 type:complete len:328 (+) Transcript_7771:4557-5540(+)